MTDHDTIIRDRIARLAPAAQLLADRDRALAALYWEAQSSEEPISLRALGDRYGLSETTVRNAVNRYRSAVARPAPAVAG